MKKFLVFSVLASSVFLLVRCSPKSGIKNNESAGTTTGVHHVPSQEMMAKGKIIFQGKCGQCHTLYAPEKYTLEAWNKILPEMYEKAQLNKKESRFVNAYVLTNAKKG